eukprot:scpid69513/ scgid5034/ P2X receptor E
MSALYYVTFKYVVIRDKRLGIAYYAMTLGVLLYACSEIILNKGYLEYDKFPLGSLRLLLKDSKASHAHAETEPYCCQAASSLGDQNENEHSASCQHCRRLDAKELSWPVESRTMTISTFVKDKWQVLHSGQQQQQHAGNGDVEEDGFLTVTKESYYPLSPESLVLKVEHSFVASRFTKHGTGEEPLASPNRNMEGSLYAINGTRLKTISREGQADKISLKELLEAGGLEQGLDIMSDTPNAKGESYRNRGCVLRVSIVYENDRHLWFGTGTPTYSYRVRHVPYADYRVHQLIPIYQSADDDSNHSSTTAVRGAFKEGARLIRKRYGIHLTFEQSGKLGMFSWSSLLTKLVSSICMITIIPTVLDTAILYILPGRTRYRDSVYEDREDSETDADTKDNEKDHGPSQKKEDQRDQSTANAQSKDSNIPPEAVESIAGLSSEQHNDARPQPQSPGDEPSDQTDALTLTQTETTVSNRRVFNLQDSKPEEQ